MNKGRRQAKSEEIISNPGLVADNNTPFPKNIQKYCRLADSKAIPIYSPEYEIWSYT